MIIYLRHSLFIPSLLSQNSTALHSAVCAPRFCLPDVPHGWLYVSSTSGLVTTNGGRLAKKALLLTVVWTVRNLRDCRKIVLKKFVRFDADPVTCG
jgi:hypothetical protein